MPVGLGQAVRSGCGKGEGPRSGLEAAPLGFAVRLARAGRARSISSTRSKKTPTSRWNFIDSICFFFVPCMRFGLVSYCKYALSARFPHMACQNIRFGLPGDTQWTWTQPEPRLRVDAISLEEEGLVGSDRTNIENQLSAGRAWFGPSVYPHGPVKTKCGLISSHHSSTQPATPN